MGRPKKTGSKLPALLEQARACSLCRDQLEPRPVLRLAPESRVVIIGQAPGSKVHASGVPWEDRSGDHLREWLDVSMEQFSDPTWFGILPMGLCYPGRLGNADLPPPKICAPTWHPALMEALPDVQLTLLVGMHAQKYYLGDRMKKTLTQTVRDFEEYGPKFMPLPHPSWRSRTWMTKNPWFEAEVLPVLRSRVHALAE